MVLCLVVGSSHAPSMCAPGHCGADPAVAGPVDQVRADDRPSGVQDGLVSLQRGCASGARLERR